MPFCLFNLIVLTYFNFHKSVRWFERSRSNRIVHSHCIASLNLLWSSSLWVANHTHTHSYNYIYIRIRINRPFNRSAWQSNSTSHNFQCFPPAYSLALIYCLSFLYIFDTNPLLIRFSTIFHCDNFRSFF